MINFSQVFQVTRIHGFWLLVLAVFMLGVAFSLTHPFMSLFAMNEVKMTSFQFGTYIVVSAVSGIFASMLIGRMSDSGVNRKGLILVAIAAATINFIVFSQVRNFAGLILSSVLLMSIGWSAFSQIFAFARAKFEQEHVGDITLATNALRMFFSLAWVVGPILGAMVAGKHEYATLFLVTAGMFIVAGFCVSLISLKKAEAPVPVEKTLLLFYVRQRHIWASTVGLALMTLSSGLAMFTLPVYIVEDLRGSNTDVGILFGVAAALEMPLMLLMAFISKKVPKSRLMWIGALTSAAYFTWAANATHVWHMYPAQILTAVFVAIVMGIGISYFQDMLPGVPGVSTALYSNAFSVGQVLAGVVFAGLAPWVGYRGVLVSCVVFSSLAALLLFHYGHKNEALGQRAA
jgi:SET family sugar efflux transporter-like MFS transporter